MRSFNIIKSAAIGGLLEKTAYQNFMGMSSGQSNSPGKGDSFTFSQGIANLMGDKHTEHQLEQAAQPSPQYLERANKKGVLGKYYDDKVKQDYAINPSVGDTGRPAKAIYLDPAEQAKSVAAGPASPAPASVTYPAPEPDINALFRKHHATAYDPKSRVDRMKMQQLIASQASASASQPTQKPDMNALFRKHHATDFDPKSRVDRMKMQKLIEKMGQ